LPEDGRSSKRPNIREQSYLQVKDGMFANEEESIYGRLKKPRIQRFTALDSLNS